MTTIIRTCCGVNLLRLRRYDATLPKWRQCWVTFEDGNIIYLFACSRVYAERVARVN